MENSKKKYLLILGSFLVVLFLTVVGLFIYEYTRIKPNNVRFSNITSSSVTVSWNTKKPTSASVIAFEGDTSLPVRLFGFDKEKYYDTRDVKKAELEAIERTSEKVIEDGDYTISSNEIETEVIVTDRGDYYTHHVSVNGLDPEKEYSFMIGDEYLYRKVEDINNNIVVSTLEIPEEIKSPYPAYGSVKDAQNQTELPIDQLAVISDGIVYFNYYENTTGGRSNLFSSVLSNSGTWYIDVSSAIDEEGVPFFQAYDSVEHEFMIELTLDAGPLGVWEKKELNGSNSPTPPIIINYPSSGNDEDVSTTKISSLLDSFVQKVFAYRDPSTKPSDVDCDSTAIKLDFLNYCGPCVKKCSDGIYYGPYTCPQSTLCSRNCVDCDDPDKPGGENPITCGGYVLGTAKKYGSDCKVCSKRPSGSYYIGAWEINNKDYDPSKNCAPTSSGGDDDDDNDNDAFQFCWNSRYICTRYNSNDPDKPGNCRNTKEDCVKDALKAKDNASKGPECGDNECTKPNETFLTCPGDCYEDASCQDKSPGSECEDGNICNEEGDCVVSTGGGDGGVCYDLDDNCIGTPYSGAKPEKCFFTKKKDCLEVLERNKEVNDRYIRTAECGKCSGTFPANDIGFNPFFNFCKTGKAINFVPSSRVFPPQGLSLQWTCYVSAENNVNCKAEHLSKKPLVINCASRGQICQLKGGNNGVCNKDDVCVKPGESCGEGKSWTNKGFCLKETGANRSLNKLVIRGGEKCPTIAAGCSCRAEGLSKTTVSPEEFCHEVNTCRDSDGKPINEGKICAISQDRMACKDGICKKVEANLDKDDSMNILGIKSIFNTLSKNVLAQDKVNNNRYIFDSKTGLLSGLSEGSYDVEYEGKVYTFEVYEGETELLLYLDENSNEQFDEGTDIKISDHASEISIVPYVIHYDYKLQRGLNFVSLPFLVEDKDYRTAASLLKVLNEASDDSIYSISKFDGGNWKIVGQNVELYDNNDFQLLPGEGYVFKAKNDVNITIPGRPVQFESEEDSTPISLNTGWNLIGLYGTNVKSYTAKSLIEDINNDNFRAINVTQWAKSKQLYEGYQLVDGKEYGFDYPLNKLESYFVRITDGSGNWQPQLGGNK